MYNKDNFLNSFCQFLSFYLPYFDYFICNICYCFLVAVDYNYLYSITKMQKKPYNQGFSLLIHTKLSRLLRAKLHTQRFAVAVSFRRKLLTLRQLSHGQNICFYFADASARTNSGKASACGASKLLYYRMKMIECFIKLYYKMKENYTLNSNNL